MEEKQATSSILKTDRFLMGILVFIGASVILALIFYFTRYRQQDYNPDNTPEAAIYNFVLALEKQDYQRAYELVAGSVQISESEFNSRLSYDSSNRGSIGVRITNSSITGDKGYVTLTMVHIGSGPFSSTWEENSNAALVQENGIWKIEQMPYPFWAYDWEKPVRP